MKLTRPTGWALAAAAVLIVAVLAFYKQRKPPAPPPSTSTSAAELAPTDLFTTQVQDMSLGLQISGTIKAVQSVLVKARVAGDLQDLTVREGDIVTAGQVLARIDPTETQARLHQAQQQAEAARAQLDIAQRQFDNNRALVQQNFISRTALDTSTANLQAAQANHRAALAAADVTRKALNDTVMRAPISGQVSQRLAQAGERLPVDGRALEIVDLRQLELEASVGAAESLQLSIGQRARLRLEGSEQFIDARLVRINPSAQTSSRSVLAYLSIDAKQSRETLRQGLFAQGTLGTGRREVVTVPVTAVRIDKPLAYVQVLEQDQVRHQGVNLGERGIIDGEERVVVDLEPGAKVLRGSVGALSDGLPVRLTNLTPSITANPAP